MRSAPAVERKGGTCPWCLFFSQNFVGNPLQGWNLATCWPVPRSAGDVILLSPTPRAAADEDRQRRTAADQQRLPPAAKPGSSASPPLQRETRSPPAARISSRRTGDDQSSLAPL